MAARSSVIVVVFLRRITSFLFNLHHQRVGSIQILKVLQGQATVLVIRNRGFIHVLLRQGSKVLPGEDARPTSGNVSLKEGFRCD